MLKTKLLALTLLNPFLFTNNSFAKTIVLKNGEKIVVSPESDPYEIQCGGKESKNKGFICGKDSEDSCKGLELESACLKRGGSVGQCFQERLDMFGLNPGGIVCKCI